MRMPGGLRKLDDKVLGSKRGGSTADDDARADGPRDDDRPGERVERTTRTTRSAEAPRTGGGDGLPSFLAVLWRVSKLVLVALALVLVLAAALVLLPANDDNVIVRNVLSLAEDVAGPFKDVLTVDDPDRMRVYNYGIGAVVLFVLATVVGKLPTGSTRKT